MHWSQWKHSIAASNFREYAHVVLNSNQCWLVLTRLCSKSQQVHVRLCCRRRQCITVHSDLKASVHLLAGLLYLGIFSNSKMRSMSQVISKQYRSQNEEYESSWWFSYFLASIGYSSTSLAIKQGLHMHVRFMPTISGQGKPSFVHPLKVSAWNVVFQVSWIHSKHLDFEVGVLLAWVFLNCPEGQDIALSSMKMIC